MHLVFVLIYLLFIALIVSLCHRFGLGRFGKIVVTIILLLAPFWDMIIAKGIMWNYVLVNSPLQKIARTVEKPESVVWIDNVWPGYDEQQRHCMVTSYLDGVHLNTLALNSEDGKFYLYRAVLKDFSDSEKLRPEHEKLEKRIKQLEEEAKQVGASGGDNKELWRIIRKEYYPKLKTIGYKTQREKEIDYIFANPEIYENLEDLPSLKYQIKFQRDRLPSVQAKFVWCDEIRIRDNDEDEEIAFSKRCLGYASRVFPNPIGSDAPFYGGARLGYERIYWFDNKVLFEYAQVTGQCHRSELNRR